MRGEGRRKWGKGVRGEGRRNWGKGDERGRDEVVGKGVRGEGRRKWGEEGKGVREEGRMLHEGIRGGGKGDKTGGALGSLNFLFASHSPPSCYSGPQLHTCGSDGGGRSCGLHLCGADWRRSHC